MTYSYGKTHMLKTLSLIIFVITLSGCVSTPKTINEFANKVTVKDSNFDSSIKFDGYELFNMKDVGFCGYDYENYSLRGWKDKKTDAVSHQLYFSVKYNRDWRHYRSASYSDGKQSDITTISKDVTSCRDSYLCGCDYKEVMGVSLSDEFLKENKDTGFSIRFNSKSSHENIITVPQEYIKGYLTIAK